MVGGMAAASLEMHLENVDYDKSINTFDIKVTDVDMDGKLEVSTVTAAQNAKVTEAEGKYKIDITFNNTFIPVASEPDDIPIPGPISTASFPFSKERTLSTAETAYVPASSGIGRITGSVSFTASIS